MPIYACLRRQGHSPDDAEDLVQGFFLHLIEHGTVARADPSHGRFRNFLRGALRWFLANERERANACKRSGHASFVQIDIVEAEVSLQSDADREMALDLQFDRQWARTLVRNALDALRSEYAKSGQAGVFTVLQTCLDPSRETPAYSVLAVQLASNEGAVKVAVHRLRSRFRSALRREVTMTVETAEEIEHELAYLRDVLAAEPARSA